MLVTPNALEDFHRFALGRVESSDRQLSLDELVTEWLDKEEEAAIHAAIKAGITDVDSGRHCPLRR